MKIAFLVGKFPSMSETFILNQITSLIDRGHQVDIYAEDPGSLTKTHQDVYKYQLFENTFYYEDVPRGYVIRLITAIQLLIKYFLLDPFLIVRSLNIFRYGREAKSLRLIYAVIPFLKTRPEYDLVQCHFGTNGIRGINLKDMGAIAGKIVTTFHGSDVSKTFQEFNDNYYDDLFIEGDYFLPISQYWQNKLIKLGCPASKTSVHHMGVDPKQLEFKPRQPSFESKIRLVSIARLVEKKGIEYAIWAVAKLKQRYPQIEYSVVGDGNLREELELLIDRLDVRQEIKILGWKEKSEIIEILSSSDILIAPSVTAQNGDCEGIPVVLMEAMCMGLPVISTLHSGIPELVQEGVTGFLVPEGDTDAICKKIIEAIEQPDLVSSMGEKGHEYINQNYNIHLLNNDLEQIFQKVLSTR